MEKLYNTCMRQAPILEELAGEGYHIGKVDVDQAPDLAGTYRVMSIPTLILFKNGEEVKRFIGLQTKSQIRWSVNLPVKKGGPKVCWNLRLEI